MYTLRCIYAYALSHYCIPIYDIPTGICARLGRYIFRINELRNILYFSYICAVFALKRVSILAYILWLQNQYKSPFTPL